MGRRTPVHVEIIIRDQSQVERMIKKFTRKHLVKIIVKSIYSKISNRYKLVQNE